MLMKKSLLFLLLIPFTAYPWDLTIANATKNDYTFKVTCGKQKPVAKLIKSGTTVSFSMVPVIGKACVGSDMSLIDAKTNIEMAVNPAQTIAPGVKGVNINASSGIIKMKEGSTTPSVDWKLNQPIK